MRLQSVLVGALLALTVASQGAAAPRIEEVDWKTIPSGDQVDAHYPLSAQRRNIGGKVTLSCLVTVQGRPTRCRVVAETPSDEGFGEAAIKVVESYGEFHPRRVNGRAVAHRINIPFSFTRFQGTMTRSDWLPKGAPAVQCLGLVLDRLDRQRAPAVQKLSGLWYHRVALDFLRSGEGPDAMLEAITDARNRAARTRSEPDYFSRWNACLTHVRGATRHYGPPADAEPTDGGGR